MTPEQMKRVREITDQFALDTPILYEDVGAAILAALADSLLNEPCTDAKEMGHGCYRAVKAENELSAGQADHEASNRIYAKCLLAMSAAREYPDFDGTDTPITRMLDDAINEVTAAINAAKEITK